MGTRKSSRPRQQIETPISVRLERSLLGTIRAQAQRTGKPISRVIQQMLETAVRMQRFPGIIFIEGPAGRRAHLAGAGLDVWEVIELMQEYGDVSALLKQFPRLSPRGVQIAQAYAKAFPEEIGAFLELNSRSAEQLRRVVPWLETVHS